MSNTFGLTRETIVICDFGSQYSHIIARRVRELNVYCEMHSCLVEEKVLRAINLKGIILSGGPFSVYEDGAPHLQVRACLMFKGPFYFSCPFFIVIGRVGDRQKRAYLIILDPLPHPTPHPPTSLTHSLAPTHPAPLHPQ